ncbi:MAG: hypothetical protein ACYC5O_19225, partial [Anaerolineae bacterium]
SGVVVLMQTGMGTEVPWLNERYRSLCSEAGHAIVGAGARSTADVLDYYRGLGCGVEHVRDRWRWTARIPYDRAIAYLAARAYSFTVSVPEAVHADAIRRLEHEVAALPGGLDAVAEVPNQIGLAFVSAPAARPLMPSTEVGADGRLRAPVIRLRGRMARERDPSFWARPVAVRPPQTRDLSCVDAGRRSAGGPTAPTSVEGTAS